MPFAVVAVTILMMSVVCGAVMASYDRASDNAEDIERENEAIEASMEGIAMHVDRGLGEIILSISNDPGRAERQGSRVQGEDDGLAVIPISRGRFRRACRPGVT